jgi:hypothetical protein
MLVPMFEPHVSLTGHPGTAETQEKLYLPDPSCTGSLPILKKTHHRKGAGGVAQGADPTFKPQYCKKKKVIQITHK